MKKYLWLMLILVGYILSIKVFADEVAQKTDGSFVGANPPKPINSSFMGDISNSTDNSAFVGEDVHQQTDAQFVGENTILSDNNNYFAGDNTDRDVEAEKDAPFAQDNSNMVKDGVFIGEDINKKTDSSFAGSGYGH